jgi:hypothetical protein
VSVALVLDRITGIGRNDRTSVSTGATTALSAARTIWLILLPSFEENDSEPHDKTCDESTQDVTTEAPAWRQGRSLFTADKQRRSFGVTPRWRLV